MFFFLTYDTVDFTMVETKRRNVMTDIDQELFFYTMLKESERLCIQLPKDENGYTDFYKLRSLISKKRGF